MPTEEKDITIEIDENDIKTIVRNFAVALDWAADGINGEWNCDTLEEAVWLKEYVNDLFNIFFVLDQKTATTMRNNWHSNLYAFVQKSPEEILSAIVSADAKNKDKPYWGRHRELFYDR